MAGIIGLDNTKLLQYNGGIDNANTNKQGLYIVSSNTANIPTGTSLFQYGGMLVTLRFGLDHYMLQLLAPRLGGNHLYFRLKIDTWLDWRKFLFE